MKNQIICVLIAICCVLISSQACCDSKKTINVEWQLLSDSAQKTIVLDYVNALDSFALAMPVIGGDTESAWAADTVHTMAQRVRGRKDSYLESWADIYLMYDYLAYGMSYFNAIIGLYEASPELSYYTINDMISLCDSLHEAFVSDGCKDLKSLSDFAFVSIHNMQLFYTLNGKTQNSDFEDPDFGFSLQCMLAVDSLCMTEQFSDIEVYQAYCFLESSAFFKMIIPLMRLFDKPSGLAKENQALVIEIASYFDEKAIPVMNYFSEGTKIRFLSDTDFEEYMLRATNYKTALLRIAKQEILAMTVDSAE